MGKHVVAGYQEEAYSLVYKLILETVFFLEMKLRVFRCNSHYTPLTQSCLQLSIHLLDSTMAVWNVFSKKIVIANITVRLLITSLQTQKLRPIDGVVGVSVLSNIVLRRDVWCMYREARGGSNVCVLTLRLGRSSLLQTCHIIMTSYC